MTTRRGFFGMLAGLAAAPLLPKLKPWKGSCADPAAQGDPPLGTYKYHFRYTNSLSGKRTDVAPYFAMTGNKEPTWDDYCGSFEWEYEPGTILWRQA